MSAREELLDVILEADKTSDGPTVFTVWDHMTDAILAAGYRKPRTIESYQSFEALATGCAVQTSDESDVVVLKCGVNMFRNQDGYEVPADTLWRYATHPLTVLYEP